MEDTPETLGAAMYRLIEFMRKPHSVSIEVDNGYGATCWSVDLRGVANAPDRKVKVYEIEIGDPNHDDWDWPGLAATINETVDRAETFEKPKE